MLKNSGTSDQLDILIGNNHHTMSILLYKKQDKCNTTSVGGRPKNLLFGNV
jgi:hypothetical protein